jgi:tetratricopeptide (TPR) repeat protein
MKIRLPASLARRIAITLAFVFAIALFLGTHTPAWSQATPTVSKALAKPLKEAQDAMKAKRYDAAIAKLKEVQGMSGKSPYDEHLMHEMFGFLYFRANDFASAARELEPGLSSGFLKPAEVPRRVKDLAVMQLRLKNYPKAIEYGQRAIKGGFADDTVYTVMEQAYYLQGNQKETMKFVNNYIDQQVKAGKTPKERSLQTLMQACTALNDTPCQTKAMERLVSYYPKGDYWVNLLDSLFKEVEESGTEATQLQLYRLAVEVNVLKDPEDYNEMAQLAMEQGAPGEAVRILEKGFASNVFTDQRSKDKNTRLLAAAKKNSAAEQAELPKLTQAAAADKTGNKDVELGKAHLSYEQYPQAIDAIQRGITKGSLTDAAQAQLLLGIAQLKGAKKDEAIKSFRAVKGDDKLKQLADLWTLRARQA